MRQLYPKRVAGVDPEELYAADARHPHDDRPWLLINMISSADGATEVGGVSGPLGAQADKQVFRAIRGVADFILVAAGTVRAEKYGPPKVSESQRARRLARGQRPVPRLAIVTATLDLDPGAAVFQSDPPPIVFASSSSTRNKRALLEPVSELVMLPGPMVDVAVALRHLGDRGAGVVLCEGGPVLNGYAVASGAVDELCLSLSPMVVGGRSHRIATGPDTAATPFSLDRVLEDEGALFLRYVRGE